MTTPVRIQLSRKRGFNLQQHSRAINGLDAVNCARPGKWGNPYKIGTCLIGNAEMAQLAFVANLPLKMDVSELRGKNLACFCDLPTPGEPDFCHCVPLLQLANKEPNNDQ